MDIIIGVGNPLRGDDGVGPHVVGELPSLHGARTIVVHQLVPELALTLRDADRVLFVDASVTDRSIALQPLAPTAHTGAGHSCTPGALLGWTELAYGSAPPAWLLPVPASCFDAGAGLSEQVEKVLPAVRRQIRAWLKTRRIAALASNEEEA